jgi:hypothetical protein
LGINSLGNGNEKNGAGKAEAYGQDSDKRPPPIPPNATPSQSSNHDQKFSCFVSSEGAKRLFGIQGED